MVPYLASLLTVLLSALLSVTASPNPIPTPEPFALSLLSLARQVPTPYFPASPPSCPICEQSYPSISSCAAAAPVLANVTEILFDPLGFIDVLKCACTDTFQSAYPQCVDCFEQTNQTDVLTSGDQNLSSVVSGMRQLCAILSTLIGGVASTDGEVPSSTTTTTSIATSTSSSTSSLSTTAAPAATTTSNTAAPAATTNDSSTVTAALPATSTSGTRPNVVTIAGWLWISSSLVMAGLLL